MKRNSMKKVLSLILCLVLIAAMALMMTGCSDDVESTAPQAIVFVNGQTLGEGEKSFSLTVVDADGKETTAQIQTDKITVGEALIELGLIAGEESEYGLYVKTVNGTTLDYDKDGKYWAFYIGDEYAMTGLENTEIVDGESYTIKAE